MAAILPVTRSDDRELIHSRVYNLASEWLAWFHLNEPLWHVSDKLRNRRANCDIQFSMEMLDSLRAAEGLLYVMGGPSENETSTSNTAVPPVALIGAPVQL